MDREINLMLESSEGAKIYLLAQVENFKSRDLTEKRGNSKRMDGGEK